jgi:glycosyltransferase involved in cell wall biosynthesis
MTARVLDIDIRDQLSDQPLGAHTEAFVLVRYSGRPLGTVRVACRDRVLRSEALMRAIEATPPLARRVRDHMLTTWLLQHDQPAMPKLPTWSVVICTRDRTDDLQRCLDSLLQSTASGGEIVVVDNAPSDDSTVQLAAQYPVRYIREDRPGLNWARSTGARAASGEIVIFTDDDVVVDRDWIAAIVEPFSHPRVAAVTGLTLPLQLETPAQELFEAYGGFGRGFERRIFDYTRIAPAAAGMVGAGANMALRRELIITMRLFDAELDCGTVAQTGGDAYAFYQLLAEGFQIVYTPEALTWHRHRREYRALRRTLAGYSVGGFAFLMRCWLQHGDWQAPAVAASWFRHDHLKQLARVLLRRRNRLPLDLVLAQIAAIPLGIRAYFQSVRDEQAWDRKTSATMEAVGGER